MTPAELTTTLHALIPMTRAMGVEVTVLTADSLELAAPLALNRNHAGSAFAGSLSSLASVAGWAFLHQLLAGKRIRAELLLADGHIRYRRPVLDDLRATLTLPLPEQQQFLSALADSGRARLQLAVDLPGQDDRPAAAFKGQYVAIALPEQAPGC